MGIGGNDAVTAKTTVESSNGDNGVPWIGGQAGGTGQPVLEFTGDIVEAGYNINMNRAVTDTSRCRQHRRPVVGNLGITGRSPDWTVDGGREYRYHLRYLPQGQHSRYGLLPKLYQESATVTTEIQNLVSGATPPTLANLDQITAPGVAITRQVIEAGSARCRPQSRA